MGWGAVIDVNGAEVAAYIVGLDGGLRIRFTIDDWERLRLFRGQHVRVRLPGKTNIWLMVSDVVEIPPVTWVVLVQRFRHPQT